MSNVLQDTDGNLTFDQYAVSDFWVGGIDADGYPTLVADVPTLSGVPYHLTFSMAANLASNQSDVAIEVSFADQVVGTFEHSGALYAEQEISFTGTYTERVSQQDEVNAMLKGAYQMMGECVGRYVSKRQS